MADRLTANWTTIRMLQERGAELGRCSRSGAAGPAGRLRVYRNLPDAIATHRVGDRLDRYEPRLRKRR